MRRESAGRRSGWRLVSGSLRTMSSGGRGVRRAAAQRRKRRVPSESSAADKDRSNPCCRRWTSVSSAIQRAGHHLRVLIILGNYGDQFAAVPVTLYRTVSELFDFRKPVADAS
jgi:hypothetical protein